MRGGPELTVALLASVVLVAGAAIRLFARRLRFPFTVAMLVLGLLAGLGASRLGAEGGVLVAVLHEGAAISPELILLVFLPALVFESAYGIDVHAFRKDLGPILLLALPALVVTTGLVAALAFVLTGAMGWTWGWAGALVFGALVSATDPVAVVALLRETGAPKRLAILIEGESLLNDGTAIVLYGALVALLSAAAPASGLDAGSASLHFLWVVIGGLVVGMLLAATVSAWISRTFNDPAVEITLTLALAYGAMVLAEGVLHVSGVIAVVVAGLWMSGPGRTHVSPEVSRFLHRFWEMLAYVANTLIFFLVGLVVAVHVDHAPAGVMLAIAGAWAGLVVVRLAVTMAFRPLMRLVGEPVSARQGLVMSWGGLRGAVSLALALSISRHAGVAPGLGDQILVVTAGVVLLTILINGTTTGWLLGRLGLTDTDAGDALADLTVRASVLDEVSDRIRHAGRSRELKALPLRAVRADLEARREALDLESERLRAELLARGDDARLAGAWRRALELERHAYWQAFAAGTLGASATRILAHEVDLHADRIDALHLLPPPSRVSGQQDAMGKVARGLRSVRLVVGGLRFGRLALLYDLFRGEALGAARVLDELRGDDEALVEVRGAYERWLRHAREAIEDLRTNLPEVTRAVETRLARRIGLNFERAALTERGEDGALDERALQRALGDVEERMKALLRGRRRLPLPETADLCRTSELFAGLSGEALDELARITLEEVYPRGEVLFHEGDPGRCAFIIARGAVHVLRRQGDREVVADILGGGDIVGEMALLGESARQATVVAATTVTVGKISRDDFEALLATNPEVRDKVWHVYARRLLDNHVRGLEGFEHTSHDARVRWADAGRAATLKDGETLEIGPRDEWLFVVRGEVELDGEPRAAPSLARLRAGAAARSRDEARVLALGHAP